MHGTAPLQGDRAKKIPTDKSRDFAYGGAKATGFEPTLSTPGYC